MYVYVGIRQQLDIRQDLVDEIVYGMLSFLSLFLWTLRKFVTQYSPQSTIHDPRSTILDLRSLIVGVSEDDYEYRRLAEIALAVGEIAADEDHRPALIRILYLWQWIGGQWLIFPEIKQQHCYDWGKNLKKYHDYPSSSVEEVPNIDASLPEIIENIW